MNFVLLCLVSSTGQLRNIRIENNSVDQEDYNDKNKDKICAESDRKNACGKSENGII